MKPWKHLRRAQQHIEELAAISEHGAMERMDCAMFDALIEDIRGLYHPIVARRSVSTAKLVDLVTDYSTVKSQYFDRFVLKKIVEPRRDS